jgi:hypothetical protein
MIVMQLILVSKFISVSNAFIPQDARNKNLIPSSFYRKYTIDPIIFIPCLK